MRVIVQVDQVNFRYRDAPAQLPSINDAVTAARLLMKEKRALIEVVMRVGAPEALPDLTALFLSNEKVILCAAVAAAKRMRWSKRPNLEHCVALAKSLKIDQPLNEISLVTGRPKKAGQFRATHDFSIRHRTAQQMVKWVMALHFKPRPWQYTMVGVPRTIKAAKANLGVGHLYYATLDIENFFGSFYQKELLNGLPLPKEWVDHVVVGRHIAVEVAKRQDAVPIGLSPHELLHMARQGLPLGSSCSPIVAAYCTAKLLWEADVVLINYADNFLLLASNPQALDQGIMALTNAVANLPGGSFNLKLIDQGHASHAFDFLGHRLRVENSEVRVSPTLANEQAIIGKLNDLDTKFGSSKNKAARQQLLVRMMEMMAGWFEVFGECDEIGQWKQYFQATLEENAKAMAIKVADLKLYAQSPDAAVGHPYFGWASSYSDDYSIS